MSGSSGAAVVVRAGEGEAVRWGPAGVIRIVAAAVFAVLGLLTLAGAGE